MLCSTGCSGGDRFHHPAPFPVELVTHCLKLAGLAPGALVLDPFAGTGATLLAAQALELDAIGIEIDPTYCAVAEERLRQEASGAEPRVRLSCARGRRAYLDTWHW